MNREKGGSSGGVTILVCEGGKSFAQDISHVSGP